jgi:hypothetical protein
MFATGNPDYTWLGNPSCYVNCRAVERIYDTFGISDRFGFNIIGGHAHAQPSPASTLRWLPSSTNISLVRPT